MGITKMRFSVQRRLLRMLKYGCEPRHCRPVSTATRRITWGEHDDACDNKDGQNGPCGTDQHQQECSNYEPDQGVLWQWWWWRRIAYGVP
jgi:hypothetical protein